MSFVFNWTCPTIDAKIKDLKSDLYQAISDVVSDASPLFTGKDKEDFVNTNVDYFYKIIEGYIEEIRETNEDMRKAAEKQIEDLEAVIEEIKNIGSD